MIGESWDRVLNCATETRVINIALAMHIGVGV